MPAIAVFLLAGSLGGLFSYFRLFGRGVAFGDEATTPIAHSDAPSLGANTFLHREPDVANIHRELSILQSAGVGIIRQQFLWEEIEPVKGRHWDDRLGRSTWERYDTIVAAARARGMEIMARLERSPRWATPGWQPAKPASQKPPADLEDFGDFVEAVVSRYKGQIRYYQIWNEPNLSGEWGESNPDAAEYVAMLKVAYRRAKRADPNAVVAAAGLAPTTERGPQNISDLIFLQRMYFLGAKDYFDVASTMSYGLSTGPRDYRADEGLTNFPRAVLWRDVMNVFGDGSKPIWASEYGWNSLPPGWAGQPSIWGNNRSPAEQAAWTVDGIRRARDEWPWMPTIFVWASRWPVSADPADPTLGFRLMEADFTARPALQALRDFTAAGPVAGAGFHQENDRAFDYQGPWPREPSDDAVLGFWATTGVAGAAAHFRFTGDSITLISRTGPDMGLLRVRLNGQEALADLVHMNQFGQAVIDLYSPESKREVRFPIASRLPGGTHLLEIMSTGTASPASTGAKVVIDGLLVANPRPLWPYAATGAVWLAVMTALAWKYSRPAWNLIPPRLRALRIEPPILPATEVFGINAAALAGAGVAVLLIAALPGAGLISPYTLIRAAAFAYLVVLGVSRPEVLAVLAGAAQPWHPVRPRIGPLTFAIPEIILAALALAWLIRGAFRRRFEVRRSGLLYAAACFAIASLAAAVFAGYPKFALRGFRTTIFEPVVLFVLLTAYLNRRHVMALVVALAAGGTLAAITAVFDPVTGRLITAGVPRLRGFYDSPNNLAFVVERTLPLMASLALSPALGSARRVLAGIVVALAGILIATFSRGAWLGSAIALVWPAVPGWHRLRPRLRLPVGALLVTSLAALGGLVGADRLSFLARASDRSAASRISLWESSLQMIRDFPIFGVGPDNFLYRYSDYLRAEAWREPNMSHPHNLVLDLWLSVGPFGTAALLAALGLFFVYLRRAYRFPERALPRPVILGLAASMTAALAHGVVDNFYFLPELAGYFWVMLACATVAGAELKTRENPQALPQ